MRANKINLLKNLYAAVMPLNKDGQIASYDLKSDKKHFTSRYEVYLINDSKYPIEKVEMLVGGYASQDDEGLLETSKNIKDFGRLDSKKALLLENLDFGMLDFMNWYHLDLHLNERECLKIWFEFNGMNIREQFLKEMPVFNKLGYNIELDLRNTEFIKDEAKKLDMNSKFHKFSD